MSPARERPLRVPPRRDRLLGEVEQRNQTVLPGMDYMTDTATWKSVQDGQWAGRVGMDLLSGARRYITTGRDLAHYVHVDQLYQAYLNACLILLGLGSPPTMP